MVFHSSNPSAPPIYPCGICHKEVAETDQAIMCESGCNFWFHRVCTGLAEAAFLFLTQVTSSTLLAIAFAYLCICVFVYLCI
jgi:hypothetical protein